MVFVKSQANVSISIQLDCLADGWPAFVDSKVLFSK